MDEWSQAESRIEGWFETRTSGNPILFLDEHRCVVFKRKKPKGWGYMICHGDGDPVWGRQTLTSLEEAQKVGRNALIDAVVTLLEKEQA